MEGDEGPIPPPPAAPAASEQEEQQELDELEALIPPAAAAAAQGGGTGTNAAADDDDDDGLAEVYRDLQDALGEGPEEEEGEAGQEGDGGETLGAEALLERCERRLRGIEAALDDYEVRGNEWLAWIV